MASVNNHPTTYVYEPLQSRRHIRLLEITNQGLGTPIYSLVEVELNDQLVSYEAISYRWGLPVRVSSLPILNSVGSIGLTANLTEALPFFAQNSTTKRLWIDQICINQADNAEKSVQVGLMSEIYKKASRVIVWLGAENEGSQLCRQWLDGIAAMIPTMQSANKIMTDSPEYNPDWRSIILRDTFHAPGTDAKWAVAIGSFFGRHWFRRGWIVQEFILAREVLCLTGKLQFSLQDLYDLYTVPSDAALSEATEKWLSYKILLDLKPDPFASTPQPLRFLRVMANVASEFITQELGDRLFGFLGLMEGLTFVPDYRKSVKHNFTSFVVTLARDFGSLDFLSLWSANLDALLKDTPEQLLGFHSWVPSYSALPLNAPWRLAVGGSRSWNETIAWNAAAGRRHTHDQTFDAVTTGRLQVRGQIIDRIGSMSFTRFAKYWDVDEAYLTSLINQIKTDLPGFDNWTHIDMIRFLNTVSHNGVPPRESEEQLLGLAPGVFPGQYKHLTKHEDSLGICLAMGRGRRFTVTEKGRKGLMPYIGSRAREEGRQGSAIVVLHGCIVPIVLESVGEERDEGGEWRVVGDCYVEGAMKGEAVEWEEGYTRTFVLV